MRSSRSGKSDLSKLVPGSAPSGAPAAIPPGRVTDRLPRRGDGVGAVDAQVPVADATSCRDAVDGRSAARVQPRERLVRGPAAGAGGEMLVRLLRLRGRGAAGGEAGELRRVPGAPVAREEGDQLA